MASFRPLGGKPGERRRTVPLRAAARQSFRQSKFELPRCLSRVDLPKPINLGLFNGTGKISRRCHNGTSRPIFKGVVGRIT